LSLVAVVVGEDGPVSTPLPWQVVVPVKHVGAAKSRLDPPAGVVRAYLARAMARDTLDSVCATVGPASVVVVTSDAHARLTAERWGARVVPDPGAGLDAAVSAGLGACREHRPGGPVAVLLGDVPALRPEDLTLALRECARHPRAVVPDHVGTGTVLLTTTGPALEPSYGVGSAARHSRQATLLALDLPRLRQDVDDLTDLQRVVSLGVGPATLAVLRGRQPEPGAPSAAPTAGP
jgi:2-phospho-L-lactate guanylyltransferase